MGNKNQFRRGILLRLLMLIDIGLLMLSFGLAVLLTTDADKWTTLTSFFATSVSLLRCALFAIALFLGHSVLVMSSVYQSKRMATKSDVAVDVLGAMTALTVCLWCAAKLFRISDVPPYFLVAFWAIATLLITVTRLLLQSILAGIRKRGRNLRHVLILGTNPRAVDFGRRIETVPQLGCRLLGFVDDDWTGMEQFKESGFRRAFHYDELAEFLRRNVVDEIAIYLPLRSFYARAAEVAQLAKHHGILVRMDTDFFGLKFAHHIADVGDGVPHIIASSHGIDEWQLLLKRIFDFACSLVLLVILSPLFLIVAALIKLTSPGSVFFAQKRVGLNKRQFTMYKFRTMVPEQSAFRRRSST